MLSCSVINWKTKKKNWLSPTSESFKGLQDIVFSNIILKDLSYLTKFSHAGALEVYHCLYTRWLPKSIYFSFHGMIAWAQLAILDFNSVSNLNQATTKEGKKRYNTSFTKMTATWSANPIKGKKSDRVFQKLIFCTEELLFKNLELPIPEITTLPANIVLTPKPNKEDIVTTQISRFSSKKQKLQLYVLIFCISVRIL